MTAIPGAHLLAAVTATMKPDRQATTACPCGQNPAPLRHLAACPAVLPSVRAWAERRVTL